MGGEFGQQLLQGTLDHRGHSHVACPSAVDSTLITWFYLPKWSLSTAGLPESAFSRRSGNPTLGASAPLCQRCLSFLKLPEPPPFSSLLVNLDLFH